MMMMQKTNNFKRLRRDLLLYHLFLALVIWTGHMRPSHANQWSLQKWSHISGYPFKDNNSFCDVVFSSPSKLFDLISNDVCRLFRVNLDWQNFLLSRTLIDRSIDDDDFEQLSIVKQLKKEWRMVFALSSQKILYWWIFLFDSNRFRIRSWLMRSERWVKVYVAINNPHRIVLVFFWFSLDYILIFMTIYIDLGLFDSWKKFSSSSFIAINIRWKIRMSFDWFYTWDWSILKSLDSYTRTKNRYSIINPNW